MHFLIQRDDDCRVLDGYARERFLDGFALEVRERRQHGDTQRQVTADAHCEAEHQEQYEIFLPSDVRSVSAGSDKN